MMPSQRISESGFIFSRHGTTFLYLLQVRLIETLHQANLSGTVSVPSDFLVEKLLERGYSRKAIDSEIDFNFSHFADSLKEAERSQGF